MYCMLVCLDFCLVLFFQGLVSQHCPSCVSSGTTLWHWTWLCEWQWDSLWWGQLCTNPSLCVCHPPHGCHHWQLAHDDWFVRHQKWHLQGHPYTFSGILTSPLLSPKILPFQKPHTPSRSETVVWKISRPTALVWTRRYVTPTRLEVHFKGSNYLQESCRYFLSLIAQIPCLFLSVAQLVLFSFSKKRCAKVVPSQSESFYFTDSPVQFSCLAVNNERKRQREGGHLEAAKKRWRGNRNE